MIMSKLVTLSPSGDLVSVDQVAHVRYWAGSPGMQPPPIGIAVKYLSGAEITLVRQEAFQFLDQLAEQGSDVSALRKRIPA